MARKKQEVESNELTTNDSPISTDLFMKLTPKQQRFLHLYSTGAYTNAQISKLLEVHPNTILAWSKRPEIKQAMEEMQEAIHLSVANQIKNLSISAVQTMGDLLNSPIDGVRLASAKDLLDRSNHKPKQEIKIDKTVTTVEQKLKSLIDDTIGDLIEGEFTEVDE